MMIHCMKEVALLLSPARKASLPGYGSRVKSATRTWTISWSIIASWSSMNSGVRKTFAPASGSWNRKTFTSDLWSRDRCSSTCRRIFSSCLSSWWCRLSDSRSSASSTYSSSSSASSRRLHMQAPSSHNVNRASYSDSWSPRKITRSWRKNRKKM